jgi:hypothetical protein
MVVRAITCPGAGDLTRLAGCFGSAEIGQNHHGKEGQTSGSFTTIAVGSWNGRVPRPRPRAKKLARPNRAQAGFKRLDGVDPGSLNVTPGSRHGLHNRFASARGPTRERFRPERTEGSADPQGDAANWCRRRLFAQDAICVLQRVLLCASLMLWRLSSVWI